MSLGLGRLLLVGLLLLLVMSGLVVAVLLLQKRQKQLDARIASVIGTHVRLNAARAPRRNTPQSLEPLQPAIKWVGRRFGIDPNRLAEYPVRWWVAVPVAFVIARVLAELMRTLIGGFAIPLIPLSGLMISRAFFGWCHSRRSNKLYVQFPDALSMIVRGVRVGIPVSEAIRTVAREAMSPTNIEFQKLADQLSIGVSLPDALSELSQRNELPEYQFFATALALQSQTGGGLSETLENLADVIRKRVGLKSRALALASEARTSIIILASLPLFAGLALAVLNPDYIATLFNTEGGQKVFAAAVVSLSTGIAVMQGIVKKSLS